MKRWKVILQLIFSVIILAALYHILLFSPDNKTYKTLTPKEVLKTWGWEKKVTPSGV